MISAYTEMSESRDEIPKGWVLFDGDCLFCRSLAERFGPWLLKRGYRVAPLQAPWVRERLSLAKGALLTEMRLLTADGDVYGGADALIAIAKTIWWAKPLAQLARLPGLHALLHAGYRSIAASRHCIAGACATTTAASWSAGFSLSPAPKQAKACTPTWTARSKWFALVLLPAAAFFLTRNETPWIMMWSLAMAIGLGCKWLTFSHVDWSRINWRRALGYLFAWPGMDPRPFANTLKLKGGHRTVTGCGSGLLSGAIGAVLLWSVARHLGADLFVGWAGMAGLVLLLHFGIFHLLAWAWQSLGVAVTPIMNAPVRSASVSDFWSRRWNIAFHQLAHEFVFRPLHKYVGPRVALAAGFLASGVVHDLVISVPARAGYGLPTAYFLLQGLAILAERRLNMSGWRARVFLIVTTFLPAFFLFHPPFIHRVFLPFMRAIGAL